jgi:hypothetical protein
LRKKCTGEYLNLREKRKQERIELHNEELHDVYSSSDIIREKKSERIRWLEHVVNMGEPLIWSENLTADLGVNGRMILKWILRKQYEGVVQVRSNGGFL